MIKTIQLLLGLSLTAFLLTACSEDEGYTMPEKVEPTAVGVWVDERDGAEYEWVQYGNLQWMARNFRYNLNDKSMCADYRTDDEWINGWTETHSSKEHLVKYGYYYSIQGALKACPEGWRLPTDQEWQQLEEIMGMSVGEASGRGWRGNVASNMLTTRDNATSLNLLLGGWYTYNLSNSLNNGSNFRGSWAFYWTSTRDADQDGELYMYRKLAFNQHGVYRHSMEGAMQLLSVRYVRDAN